MCDCPGDASKGVGVAYRRRPEAQRPTSDHTAYGPDGGVNVRTPSLLSLLGPAPQQHGDGFASHHRPALPGRAATVR